MASSRTLLSILLVGYCFSVALAAVGWEAEFNWQVQRFSSKGTNMDQHVKDVITASDDDTWEATVDNVEHDKKGKVRTTLCLEEGTDNAPPPQLSGTKLLIWKLNHQPSQKGSTGEKKLCNGAIVEFKSTTSGLADYTAESMTDHAKSLCKFVKGLLGQAQSGPVKIRSGRGYYLLEARPNAKVSTQLNLGISLKNIVNPEYKALYNFHKEQLEAAVTWAKRTSDNVLLQGALALLHYHAVDYGRCQGFACGKGELNPNPKFDLCEVFFFVKRQLNKAKVAGVKKIWEDLRDPILAMFGSDAVNLNEQKILHLIRVLEGGMTASSCPMAGDVTMIHPTEHTGGDVLVVEEYRFGGGSSDHCFSLFDTQARLITKETNCDTTESGPMKLMARDAAQCAAQLAIP